MSLAINAEGLHAIANTGYADRLGDVVFVHGLGGKSHETWRHGEQGKAGHFFWPSELGNDVPEVGIWSVGYAAGVTALGQKGMPFWKRGKNIAFLLAQEKLGTRPLIFVTHSMGGLVVKSLLESSANAEEGSALQRIAQAVRGVVFCGTPHRGADVHKAAEFLIALVGGAQEHVEAMRSDSSTLDDLHRQFRGWVGRHPIGVLSFAEQHELMRESHGIVTRSGSRLLGVVVETMSANPDIGICEEVDADHLQLVKPPRKDGAVGGIVYKGVLNFIKEHLPQEQPTVAATSPTLAPQVVAATAAPAVAAPEPRRAPRLDPEWEVESGFGLVIGVDEYAKPAEKDATPFSRLSFAVNDATEFHRYLQDCGWSVPDPLLDEAATRERIMDAIVELRRACVGQRNPLVVVYFSGHGATDEEGEQYLIPHDAVRNRLFATALWNRTVRDALNSIETNRLVVFLDACHSGAEAAGVKGALACDPRGFVDVETPGRYVVTSCKFRQVSREEAGHGIFTRELLQLLRFQTEETHHLESLELSALYAHLSPRVTEATRRRGHQEPWSNVKEQTDIVLAVNRSLLEKKALLAIVAQFETWFSGTQELDKDEDTALLAELRSSINRNEESKAFKILRFQGRELHGKALSSHDLDRIGQQLIDIWRETHPRSVRRAARGAFARGEKPRESASQGLAEVSAQSDPRRESSSGGGPAEVAVQSLLDLRGPVTAKAAPVETRRRYDADNVNYIRGGLVGPDFLDETSEIRKKLTQPGGITENEFFFWLADWEPTSDAARELWPAKRQEVVARFQERKERGEVVEPSSALNLRLRGGV